MTLANLAARFLLELVGIGAVGYWGYQAVDAFPARLAVSGAAVSAMVVVWAVVVAPNATNAIGQDVRIVIGSGVLLLAAGALAAAGQPTLALAVAGAIIINTILLFALGHEIADALPRSA
jgi:Protein of unknown function (DUF2568)